MTLSAVPFAQSEQFTAVTGIAVENKSEPWRQVPAFLNSHQAGSTGPYPPKSTTISLPTRSEMSMGDTHEPTSVFVPLFVSHANDLLDAPPSPRQASQRRFTRSSAWALPANVATSANARAARARWRSAAGRAKQSGKTASALGMSAAQSSPARTACQRKDRGGDRLRPRPHPALALRPVE